MKKRIEEVKADLINSIIKAVNYKSVSTSTNSKDAPFGDECKKVLEYVLSLGRTFGFKTKNIDGYCGYIELGEGEELLGIIGHLDVVPANIEDGWTSSPFNAEIRNNKIYGRGTIDDKGPVIACLYAMKLVSETTKLNKRVRLILGLNEEKDWECIERYKQTEELPTISFSPDASFPCIYAEKGIITLCIKNNLYIEQDKITDLTTADNAINVVPKSAYAIVKTYDKTRFIPQQNIIIEELDNNSVKITATGKAAHAAFPTIGDNAATRLLKYINNIYHNSFLTHLEEIDYYALENPQYLGGDKLTDESGTLTSSIGVLEYKDNELLIKTNLRVPVNTNFEQLEVRCKETLPDLNFYFEQAKPKLYISKDNHLVQTLTKIFNETTGLNAKPLAIGGGTYARAFDNCISYGMSMPHEEELSHQVDENIDIDNLLIATEIYAKAIIELAK